MYGVTCLVEYHRDSHPPQKPECTIDATPAESELVDNTTYTHQTPGRSFLVKQAVRAAAMDGPRM